MSELQQLSKQINELTRLVSSMGNPVPLNKQIWGRKKVAAYLDCSVDTFDRMRAHPAFPKGHRRSFDGDKGGALLWKAEEVVRFAEQYIFE